MLSPGYYNFELIREDANLKVFRLDTPSNSFYDVYLQPNGDCRIAPLNQNAKQMMDDDLVAQIQFKLKEFLDGLIGVENLSFTISY